MKARLLATLFAVFSLTAVGQTSDMPVSERYDSLLIHQFSTSRWMLGDKKISNKTLRKVLAAHPVSAAMLKKHNRNRVIYAVCQAAAAAAYIAGFIVLENNEEAGIALLGGGVITSLGTSPFTITADRSLHRAVWLYNRAILTGDTVSAVNGGK